MPAKRFSCLQGKESIIRRNIYKGESSLCEIAEKVGSSYGTVRSFVERDSYLMKRWNENCATQDKHTADYPLLNRAAIRKKAPTLENMVDYTNGEITTKEGVRRYLLRRGLHKIWKQKSVKKWNRQT